MTIMVYSYAGVYCLFAFWVIASGISHKDPFWKIAADALLFLIGFVGMLLYIFNAKTITLVAAWRPISLVLLIGQVVINLYDRRRILSGKDATFESREISKRSVVATDLIALIMILPAIIINLLFAYF